MNQVELTVITVISFKFRDSRNKSYASSELLNSFHFVSDVVDAVSMKGKDDEALNMIWDFSGFTEWASSLTAASNEMANLNWYIFQSPNMFCKSYDSDDIQLTTSQPVHERRVGITILPNTESECEQEMYGIFSQTAPEARSNDGLTSLMPHF